MVRVVDVGPDKSLVKEVVCKNCSATLEYVPRDIESRTFSDYGGGSDTIYFIKCPPCGEEVYIKRY